MQANLELELSPYYLHIYMESGVRAIRYVCVKIKTNKQTNKQTNKNQKDLSVPLALA